MKKMGLVLLAATLLLCSCNETPATSSADASSTVVSEEATASVKDTSSKKDNSSKNTSSWTLDVAAFIREIDGENYFDVSAAAAASPRRPDDHEFFPEADGFVGYYIEKGVYSIDADTMHRVVKYPFKGDGSIKWASFKPENYANHPDQFDGVLPISKMDDPLFAQMCLPNEQGSPFGSAGRTNVQLKGRINASNLYPLTDAYSNALPIGQIFWDPEQELPEDAEITLCFGKITLCARTKDSDGWFIASQMDCKPDHIYPFPTGLENQDPPVTSKTKGSDRVQWVDDHYEVKLTAEDFNGKLFKDDRVTAGVLHFWGKFFQFEKGGDVLGIASSYSVWVKESKWSGCMTADIGADIRGNNAMAQAFTGINYVITDQPRLIIGHNVGPKAYDEVMDSKKVLELIEWDKFQDAKEKAARS